MYRVIIVDDEPVIVRGLSRTVDWEKWNCEVVGLSLIHILSMEAGRRVKEEGADNQLMSLIAQDEMFHLDEEALEASLEPSRYVGCSAHQVERFLDEVIRPVLKENEAVLGMKAEINV